MMEDDLEQIVGKARKLHELRRARDRVRQLERELRGEPVKPEEPDYVPEFLRAPASGGRANTVPHATAGRAALELPQWMDTAVHPKRLVLHSRGGLCSDPSRGSRRGPGDRRLV